MRTQFICLAAVVILLSDSAASQWVQTNGPYGGSIITLGASSNGAGGVNLFASTHVGVFRSTDNGAWWTYVDVVPPGDPYVVAFGSVGTKIFAATANPERALFSTDNGTSWHTVIGLPGFNAMCASGANVVAGTPDGMFLSTDSGTSWTNVNPSLGAGAFATIGTKLFAGDGGIFVSTDNGASWAQVNPLPVLCEMNCLAAIDNSLLAGTNAGVFKSTDYGTTWTQVNSGLTSTDVRWLALMGTNLFAGAFANVFLSTNNGDTWTRLNLNLSFMVYSKCFAVSGTDLFVGAYTGFGGGSSAGVWRTTDNGSTWATANSGITNGYASSIAANADCIFAGTIDQGVFVSTNGGNNWTVTGPANTWIRSFTFSGTNLFAGTGSGVFLSTNNGANWTAVNQGLPSDTTGYRSVHCVASSGQSLFACTGDSGVYLSTNNGSDWSPANTPFSDFSELARLEPYLFAGTGGGVFRSSDNGTRWTAINSGLTDTSVICLAVSGTDLFAGTGSGVFHSTNNGTSWSAANTGLPNTTVRSLAISGTNLFAQTGDIWRYGYGVFLSTNNGASWREVSTGLPIGSVTWIDNMAVNRTHLLIAVKDRGVWRRPLSEMTGVDDRKPLPAEFELAQNYPNPFNPSTTIRYALPHASDVTLTVFNTLGQKIAELVKERKEAGYHEVQFDGGRLPSGVYFYRLQAGSFVDTKKLVLTK